MYLLELYVILMEYVSLKEVGVQETNPTGTGRSSSGEFSEYAFGQLTAVWDQCGYREVNKR